jgi:hypothetical protein
VKCAECGKEIPKGEEEVVQVNGDIYEQVAYCAVCLPKKKEEIKKELRISKPRKQKDKP